MSSVGGSTGPGSQVPTKRCPFHISKKAPSSPDTLINLTPSIPPGAGNGAKTLGIRDSFQLFRAVQKAGEPYAIMRRLHEGYGASFLIWAGFETFLMVGEPDVSDLVFSHPDVFPKIGTRPFAMIAGALGQSVLTDEGEPWKNERAVVMAGLKKPTYEPTESQLTEATVQMIERWQTRYALVDLHKDISRLVFRMTFQTLTGVSDQQLFSLDLNKVRESLSRVISYISKRILMPLIPMFLNKPLGGIRKDIAHLKQVIQEITVETSPCLLSELRASSLSPEAQIDNFLHTLAAAESTATAITFALYEAGRHPTEFQRLKDAVRSNDDAYVQRFLKECGRMHTVSAPQPRKAAQDFYYQGKRFKKGTQVVVNVDQLNHDKNLWGDSETFRPNRHLERKAPRVYRFGDGSHHRCLGAGMAEWMETAVLKTVAERIEKISLVREGPIQTIIDLGHRPVEPVLASIL